MVEADDLAADGVAAHHETLLEDVLGTVFLPENSQGDAE